MEANNKLREVVGDLLYMAERYVKKTPAIESVIFDAKTKKVIRTVNYYDAIANAKAALAEPLRNYEVGTEREQARRFLKYCVKQDCEKACPFRDCKNSYECAFGWSRMPYEEGGAK